MNHQQPVYTEKTECQDCCKCVRTCPVKAIKMEDGSAVVVPELCIACGSCVGVCPVGAKHVRDDLGRARQLLERNDKVIVSLAPSYVSEFSDIEPGQLIAALQRLGFYGVSETALGAQEVSAAVVQALQQHQKPVLISSACPTVVDLLNKYMPEEAEYMTDLCSPLLAHCRLLKRTFGNETRIVFIGPCISKKKEADHYPELLDLAISFKDLRQWFERELLEPETLQGVADCKFIPAAAEEGSMYPVDGGMIAGIEANCRIHDSHFMAFSGIDNVRRALIDVRKLQLQKPLFLELLACEGGCINGPQSAACNATVVKRGRVLSRSHYPTASIPRPLTLDADLDRREMALEQPLHSSEQIRVALTAVGKYRNEDELNCGGCGYGNCREFAEALLDAKAEPTMCISYMRKLAQKKANALIRTMPSGVVIVRRNLRIVECNMRFAKLLGAETVSVYEQHPGMEHAYLPKVASFLTPFFKHVLETGEDILERDIKCSGRVFHMSIFSIEKYSTAGGVIQDITNPAVRKEQIIQKTQDVIKKNLATVQQIAYLLGENAAESQVMLNTIIESFSPDAMEEPDQ